MPRRSLAEECRTSRTRARLSAEAECLLDRLITVADDFGIFEADPEVVAAQAFSRRPGWFTGPDHAARLLVELTRAGKDGDPAPVLTYKVGRVTYGYFQPEAWARFQGWPRAKRSKFPLPAPTHCDLLRALARKRAQMRADASQSDPVEQSCSRPTPSPYALRSTPSDPAREGSTAPAGEGTGLSGAIAREWVEVLAEKGLAAVPDLSGAGIAEVPLRHLTPDKRLAVLRAFRDDAEDWVAKHRQLRFLDAGRVNGYLLAESARPASGASGFDCSRIAELDEPPEPPPGWVPPPPAPVRVARKAVPRG